MENKCVKIGEFGVFLNILCKIWGIWCRYIMCKNWGIWCIPKYLGNIWGIYGVILCIPKYLGNIWGIYGEYLGE